MFLTFLTLKAWDIGATQPVNAPASLKAIAWSCAWWTMGAGAAIIGVRWVFHGHRWYFLTGAALLHVALHGFLGLSYLAAGLLAVVLAGLSVAVFAYRKGAVRVNLGGAP